LYSKLIEQSKQKLKILLGESADQETVLLANVLTEKGLIDCR